MTFSVSNRLEGSIWQINMTSIYLSVRQADDAEIQCETELHVDIFVLSSQECLHCYKLFMLGVTMETIEVRE